MRMKRNPINDYNQLLATYYGLRRAVPAASSQSQARIIVHSFDDGNPVVSRPPGDNTSGAVQNQLAGEYDVSIDNPDFSKAEYELPGQTAPDLTTGEPAGQALAPSLENDPLPTAVDSRTEDLLSGAAPAIERDTESAAIRDRGASSTQDFTRRALKQIIKNDQLFNDLDSILSGQEPSPRAQSAPPQTARPAAPAQPTPAVNVAGEPEFKNEHAIFDRIKAQMRYAEAYDLGTYELERRFNAFDLNDQARRTALSSAQLKPAARTMTTESSPLVYAAQQPASSSAPTNDPNWPPAPANLRPYTESEKEAVFGRFEYEPDTTSYGGDGIRILGSWENDNIISVPIPQLVGKLFGNRPITQGAIRFHRAGQQALIDLWNDWESAGLLDRVISFQGGFASRYIRRSSGRTPRPISNHARGTAFDINGEWNQYGAIPALVGQPGCVRELVEIANRHGFYWGGHFNRNRDGMHFELAQRI